MGKIQPTYLSKKDLNNLLSRKGLRDIAIPYTQMVPFETVAGSVSDRIKALDYYESEDFLKDYSKKLNTAISTATGGQDLFEIVNNKIAVKSGLDKVLIKSDDDPENMVFKNIYNQLVEYGGVPQHGFFENAFKNHSMTGNLINFVAGFSDNYLDLAGFDISEDGAKYRGKKLRLAADEAEILQNFIAESHGAYDDRSFVDQVAQTFVGLSFDIPLLILTGGLSAKAMAATSLTRNLAKAGSFWGRMTGQAIQQGVNFNLLGAPSTIRAGMNRSIDGVANEVFHNMQMGTIASITGTLGAFSPNAVSVVSKGIRESFAENPLLYKELGTLGGSFGFGYASTKIGGGEDIEGIATGLAFAATHFTNPNAYQKIIKAQRMKPVELLVTGRNHKGDPTFHPDYFIRDGEKLFILDKEALNKGEIVKSPNREPLELTENISKSLVHYNAITGHYYQTFKDALEQDRIQGHGKEIYNEWVKDLPNDYIKQHKDELRHLSEVVAASVVIGDLKKIFSRTKLPETKEIDNKIIELANGWDMSVSDIKKYIVGNLGEYIADPEIFMEKVYSQIYDYKIADKFYKTFDDVVSEIAKHANAEYAKASMMFFNKPIASEWRPEPPKTFEERAPEVKTSIEKEILKSKAVEGVLPPTEMPASDKYRFIDFRGEIIPVEVNYKKKTVTIAGTQIELPIPIEKTKNKKDIETIFKKKPSKKAEKPVEVEKLPEVNETVTFELDGKKQTGKIVEYTDSYETAKVNVEGNVIDVSVKNIDKTDKPKSTKKGEGISNIDLEKKTSLKQSKEEFLPENFSSSKDFVKKGIELYAEQKSKENVKVSADDIIKETTRLQSVWNKHKKVTKAENVDDYVNQNFEQRLKRNVEKAEKELVKEPEVSKELSPEQLDKIKTDTEKELADEFLKSKGKGAVKVDKKIQETKEIQEEALKDTESKSVITHLKEVTDKNSGKWKSKEVTEALDAAWSESERILNMLVDKWGAEFSAISSKSKPKPQHVFIDLMTLAGANRDTIAALLRMKLGNDKIGVDNVDNLKRTPFSKFISSKLAEVGVQVTKGGKGEVTAKDIEKSSEGTEIRPRDKAPKEVLPDDNIVKKSEKPEKVTFKGQAVKEETYWDSVIRKGDEVLKKRGVKDPRVLYEEKMALTEQLNKEGITDAERTAINKRLRELDKEFSKTMDEFSGKKGSAASKSLGTMITDYTHVLQNRYMGNTDTHELLRGGKEARLYETMSNNVERLKQDPQTRADVEKDIKKIFPDAVVGWDVELPEGKGARTFIDKDGKVHIDFGLLASADAPLHERMHAQALLAVGKDAAKLESVLKEIRPEYDGVYGSKSWVDAHESLVERAMANRKDKYGVVSKIRETWEKLKNYFRGKGWYSASEFYRKLLNNEIDIDKPIGERPLTELYEMVRDPHIDPKNENDLHNYLMADPAVKRMWEYGRTLGLRDAIRKTPGDFIDSMTNKMLFRNNRLVRGITNAAAKLYKQGALGAINYADIDANFTPIYNELNTRVVRGVAYHANRIMQNKESGWWDGRVYRQLPQESLSKISNACDKYVKETYDGIIGKDITWEQFKERYSLTDKEMDVFKRYSWVVNESNNIAREGAKNVFLEIRTNIANGLSLRKINDLFSTTEAWKEIGPLINTYKEDKTTRNENAIYEKLNSIIESNYDLKLKVAEYLAEKVIPKYDVNKVYLNTARNNNPDLYVIKAWKPSSNKNHAPIKNENGDIIGYKEQIDMRATEKELKNVLEQLYADGFALEKGGYFKISDVIKNKEFNRLTAAQLISLANQGHIPLNNEIVQKLLNSIKTGTFLEHTLEKRFIPGADFSSKGFEKNLNDFVHESISMSERQLGILKSRKMLEGIEAELASRSEVLTEAQKDRYRMSIEQATKYINNLTYSDRSAIDNVRKVAMTWFTSLKASFLGQQAIQGIQTTFPLVISEYAELGKGVGESWKRFTDATVTAKKMAMFEWENIRSSESKYDIGKKYGFDKEFIDAYEYANYANILGNVGIKELTSQMGSVDYYYAEGVNKSFNQGIKAMNMLSGGIEKWTRFQAFSSFYEIGKEKGLSGKDLDSYIAGNINRAMGQYGASGRPTLAASKKYGVKQSDILKAWDKSYTTFRTFSAHNLGIYDNFIRNKKWSALVTKMLIGLGLHGIFRFPFLATVLALANIFTDDDAEYELLSGLDNLDSMGVGRMIGRGAFSHPSIGIDLRGLLNEMAVYPTDILAETRAHSFEGKLAEAMFGAPYGFAKNTIDGVKHLPKWLMSQVEKDPIMTNDEKRMVNKNVSKLTPLFIKNMIDALSLKTDGLYMKNNIIIKPDNMTWGEVVYKFFGFNPTSISETYEEQFYGLPAKISRLEGKIREIQKIKKDVSSSEKNPEVKRAIMKKASEEHQKTLKELAVLKWSSEYKELVKSGRLKR